MIYVFLGWKKLRWIIKYVDEVKIVEGSNIIHIMKLKIVKYLLILEIKYRFNLKKSVEFVLKNYACIFTFLQNGPWYKIAIQRY